MLDPAWPPMFDLASPCAQCGAPLFYDDTVLHDCDTLLVPTDAD